MNKTILLLFFALLTSCSADNVLCNKIAKATTVTTTSGTTYLISNTDAKDVIVLTEYTLPPVAE